MVVGGGLIGGAFLEKYHYKSDVCIFASGVSDSSSLDFTEFGRERGLLLEVLKRNIGADVFVYFGTCSLEDESLINSPYVRHKLEMEALVKEHPNFLIIRLPQLAGKSENKTTLLNYLSSCIFSGERFELWSYATRNIIDISDVVEIAERIIKKKSNRNMIFNLANIKNYSLIEIVSALEKSANQTAIYESIEKGSSYNIDVSFMANYLEPLDNLLSSNYLQKTIDKYYKKT